ncbi:Carbamoyl-phosphate synthase [Brettanomyces nanus]|uniref:Pyrimidine-specific carbamoyl phosphate synthase-aspartate carbamoyl transferase n=1 Tax=Eeniella nana TaxID=13502 RepID=A0A875S469_EENNA|nr:Carbamoyl-phosphate synthase [Brettanomyces nanus]QPG75165.1 Carbamoyl-phosphate synthase [Brettanomyces nanus]
MIKLSKPITAPLSEESKLVTLETQNGTVVCGYSFGADISAAGELVFQTGMVGYPEALTDPSYEGQILVMTYPLIGNYGVPDREARDDVVSSLPKYFESHRIHISGLVVASYTKDYSHYLAKSSLGEWLKEQGIPAIYAVDTRALTKQLREKGSTLGRLCIQKPSATATDILDTSTSVYNWHQYFDVPDWVDPNTHNLVARVSAPKPVVYDPPADLARIGSDGKPLRILAIDVGMKFNQIRCFVKRGVSLKVVPYNYDFSKESYDGLFVSNGPGDPSVMSDTVEKLSVALADAKTPVFGICLGHQLLARAAGASTLKLKFGNRGQNIPCTCTQSGRCYITSQNHGYAVDVATLPENWKELFVNANDGSNEGIYSTEKPFFSVQFHPESTPGPRDTEFLFDLFIDSVADFQKTHVLKPIVFPGGTAKENEKKHPRLNIKKVLVLGSGGLSIGQAGEFDYSGSQAIKALKEEGIYTILINPNIATIQTSKGMADKIYFLPVNPDFVRKVIKHERPDAIYCTFGGQTALNVGVKLRDEFADLGVKVLGTPIETIMTTEDRELFARAMEQINEKCAKSESANNLQEALNAAHDIHYPVICRAAYALGGLGSGFAYNDEDLTKLCDKAFAISSQVLIERSMKGWKEIEYEVVRDAYDNCITVCNMENFDPLGIHTGDSIVIAPSQTLSDADYNMLRTTAVNVIRHLGVVGECNIQYALNPESKEYCIIEVNARLSRSSALASKATGYPLAYTAAKLGLNIPLTGIKNSVTKVTCACFEPSLDYCVVKIPRWDLRKFSRVSTSLSSSMKSVGEVMSIGRNFEEAIQKAIRSTDYQNLGFNVSSEVSTEEIDQELEVPSDRRLFAVANAMVKGYSAQKVHDMTKIDLWFLYRLEFLIKFGHKIASYGGKESLPLQVLRQAKQLGFEDRQIAKFLASNEVAIRRLRKDAGVLPFVKQIDTVAAEFPAFTNYLYITYNADESDVTFDDHGVMVLGSGVYRIGSSVEFDWCAVRAIRTLRENGYKTIMVNFNPETVSTDYDEADRLYFETIDLERVLDIYELEKSSGVVVSMGGQTSNNIALQLSRQNVNVLGTSPEMIDSAENRYKFSRMLDRIGVDQPAWKELTSFSEAAEFAENVHYPVLVRPSYVLSGAAMNTCWSKDDLANYLNQAVTVSPDYPVVITKYLENAKEIEMDAVAKDGKLVMHVVAEHVENAGVHSGDATLVVPPQDLSKETVERIVEATAKIGKALAVTGPYNIQFMAKNNEIKVIECNVRASRSFPFNSKVVGTDMIEMATRAIMDMPLTPYPGKKLPDNYCAVKVPQFSFSRLSGADPILGVEMASTGEVACFGHDTYEAYVKSLIASGFTLPKKNILLSIGSFKEKQELLPFIEKLRIMGYHIFATSGTADFIHEHGIPVKYLELLNDDEEEQKAEYSLTQHLANNLIDLYINLPSANRFRRPANYVSKGYRTRRMAVDYAVPLVTNVKCAKLLIEALSRDIDLQVSSIDSQSSHTTIELPGLVALSTFVPNLDDRAGAKAFEDTTKVALASGFSFVSVLPYDLSGAAITDVGTLARIHDLIRNSAYTDYSFSVAATEGNSERIQPTSGSVSSLFVKTDDFNIKDKVINLSSHFSEWPETKPIIADANKTDLASVLLLASLFNTRIHVTNVTESGDLSLIAMAKEKDLGVTCDVSVYSLFLSQKDYPNATFLPTKEDQKALWDNLDQIDCFSVGYLPTELASFLGKPIKTGLGFADVVPLLLQSVSEGKLTVDDIRAKMHDNPIKILGLGDVNSVIEVDEDRLVSSLKSKFSPSWSPFQDKDLRGAVERVLMNDQTVCLEGEFVVKEALGKEGIVSAQHPSSLAQDSSKLATGSSLSETSVPPSSMASPMSPILTSSRRRSSRLSFDASKRTALKAGFRDSLAIEEIEHLTGADLVSSLPPRELSPPNAISSLISSKNPFLRKSILSVNNISRDDLHALFAVAQEMKLGVERKGVLDILKSRVLVTAFYEPSTRTASSFNTAMQRLGGRVVAINSQSSSVKKGETLQDTIRTLACYADAIVLRHPSEDSAYIAAKYSPVPIINGGNGSREHPTQAFLDLFTIREELGTINGITITFMGDLKYGRPVHSLIKLLKHYQVKVQLVSPKELRLPRNLVEFLKEHYKPVIESTELTKEIIARSDVLYCTRVQEERFDDKAEYERLKDAYIVDNKILSYAKQHMCVMHPLPRIHEIKEEVDFDQRAAYFREMRYGLFVRMALLAMVIGVEM